MSFVPKFFYLYIFFFLLAHAKGLTLLTVPFLSLCPHSFVTVLLFLASSKQPQLMFCYKRALKASAFVCDRENYIDFCKQARKARSNDGSSFIYNLSLTYGV